jgi:hypothetical protein
MPDSALADPFDYRKSTIAEICLFIIRYAIVTSIAALILVQIVGETQVERSARAHAEPVSESSSLDIWAELALDAIKTGPSFEWLHRSPSPDQLYPPYAKRLFPVP